MLRVRVERGTSFTVLRCKGRIVAGRECKVLVKAALSETTRDLVLDLADVASIDAAGLGTLVLLHNRCAGRGRRVQLFNPNAATRRLLAMMRLDSVLEIRIYGAPDRSRTHTDTPPAQLKNLLLCSVASNHASLF